MGFFSEKTITYKNPQVRVQKNYPEMKKREGRPRNNFFCQKRGWEGGLCEFNKFDSSRPLKDARMMHQNSQKLHFECVENS